jgi:hypothetical protein
MPKKQISQMDFVKEYFIKNAGVEIHHSQSKKDLEDAWLKATGKRMEDSDRAIRMLHGKGFLQKRGKGIYLYDPNSVQDQVWDEFTEAEKRAIFERDGYKCVTCGLGRENGLELHIDHIKPRSLGGQGTVENGQTLCSRHNFIKKNHSQTDDEVPHLQFNICCKPPRDRGGDGAFHVKTKGRCCPPQWQKRWPAEKEK